jgi:Flp pilus assembly protein TadG
LGQKIEGAAGVGRACGRRAGRLRAWWVRHGIEMRQEDGGSMIEFAVSIGAALTLIFVLMQLCIALYTYGMIGETAREATRWAIVRGSTCTNGSGGSCTTTTSGITSYAQSLGFPNIGGGTLTITPSYVPASCQTPGCQVSVVVGYTVPINLPFVPHNAIAMQSSSEMYIVQ